MRVARLVPLAVLCALLSHSAVGAERIKAFCIDFNWGPGGTNGFAGPGVWADASPEEHVAWYKALGCNTIQTFAVSCNGYAWYKGGIVPPQLGLEHDFLREVVDLGHKEGMKVMGYFCAAANTRWALEHPELSYGTPGAPHIPFTKVYLDFLCASIADALTKTGMDGFMIDWVWCPSGADGRTEWLPCEQEMFGELMGTPFPGKEKITAATELAFQRKAIDRCWSRMRAAAKQANPRCVIWLSCGNVTSPQVTNSKMFREVDWLMNEATDPRIMAGVRKMKGPNTRLVQCVVGWGAGHDARKIVLDPANRNLGLYGFAAPRPNSLPLSVGDYRRRQVSAFEGNDRNIAVLARYYSGSSVEDVVEPDAAGRASLTPSTVTVVGGSPVVADDQIGNWEKARDSVRWRFRIRTPGRFEVRLRYACIPAAAGSHFSVRVDGETRSMVSRATGATWRDYKTFSVGAFELAAGEHVVQVVPVQGRPWNPISLKTVEIVPALRAGNQPR